MAEPLAIAALKTKRAELAGYVNHLQNELAQARADIVHIDATLRVFGCDEDPELIPVKRHPGSASLFPPGELPRLILSMLRTNPDGLTVAAIAESVMAKEGWTDAGPEFRRVMCARVRNVLNRYRRRSITASSGDGLHNLWRIKR